MHSLLQLVIPLLDSAHPKLLLYHLFLFNILRLSHPLDNLNSLLKQVSRNVLFFLGKLLLQMKSLSFEKKDSLITHTDIQDCYLHMQKMVSAGECQLVQLLDLLTPGQSIKCLYPTSIDTLEVQSLMGIISIWTSRFYFLL